MIMFDKLGRKGWSSSAYRTETVTTMGHERSLLYNK